MGALEFVSSIVRSIAWPAAVILLIFVLRGPLVKMLSQRAVKTFEAGPTGVRVEYFDEKLQEARNELAEGRAERPSVPAGAPEQLPWEDEEGEEGEERDGLTGTIPRDTTHEPPTDRVEGTQGARLRRLRPELAGAQLPDASPEHDDFMSEMKRLAEVAPSAAILESFARLERVLREALQGDSGNGQTSHRPVSVRELMRQAIHQGLLTPSELEACEEVADLRNLVAHGGTAGLDTERSLAYASLIRQLIISISLAQGRTMEGGPIR